jgi:hypothetical protein
MRLPLGKLLKPVFPLSAEAFPKMAAQRFGAQEDMDKTWHTFEPVASTLVDFFYLTLDDPRHHVLVPRLESVAPELRGIAYEGAGMGLMLLDSHLDLVAQGWLGKGSGLRHGAISRPLAIRSTILAPLCWWAVATRMCAFVAMVFGHDPTSCLSNTTPSDRAQWFWGSRQHTPYARVYRAMDERQECAATEAVGAAG